MGEPPATLFGLDPNKTSLVYSTSTGGNVGDGDVPVHPAR